LDNLVMTSQLLQLKDMTDAIAAPE
jgi:hypothetical protein